MLNRDAEKDILPFCAKNKLATLTYMSLEQGLLTGKIGMDRVFKPGEFRANEFWNAWMIPDNRRRVIDLLGRWNELTDKYQCTLAQLVIAWTAAQPGVTHVLAGGRTVLQVTENVRAGELKLAPADIKRIREDVVALGELAPAGKAAGA
jgi:methylglyoxal reductase